jgi:hypothetical protein
MSRSKPTTSCATARSLSLGGFDRAGGNLAPPELRARLAGPAGEGRSKQPSPLVRAYTFAKDTKKGQTNGEGLNAFGGTWDVVSPAGAKVEKQKSSAPASGG